MPAAELALGMRHRNPTGGGPSCKDCGRHAKVITRGRCLICHNKAMRGEMRPGLPIVHPQDDEMQMLMDGLIAQRAKALRPENVCRTDDPAEERRIRARLEPAPLAEGGPHE